MQQGAIWLIDDDLDDHEIVGEIVRELALPNELVFLSGAKETMAKLDEVDELPFIIICDVNLPKIDGFQLREKMLASPSTKSHSVPFIYWSSYASEVQIRKAYDLSAHGFFIKEGNFKDLKETFIQIVRYWQKSKMPQKKP